MTNTLALNTSTPTTGLATQTFTVVTAGLYTVSVKYFIPYQAIGSSGDSTTTSGGSSLQVLVKQGNTTKLTLTADSPYEPVLGGSVTLNCSAADVLTVVPSSSGAPDNTLNAVKAIVNVFQGQGA